MYHLFWCREMTSVGEFSEKGCLFLGEGPYSGVRTLGASPGDSGSHPGVFRPPDGQEPDRVARWVHLLPGDPPPLEGSPT